ncbi:MAG: hypothetical protein ACR2FU_06625 [Streptosporangiaceae bacterium]
MIAFSELKLIKELCVRLISLNCRISFTVVRLLAVGEDRGGGDGSAGGLGEGRHAQVHGGGPPGGELVHLGELGGRRREADLESFDLTGPAVLLGFGDAVLEVAADAGQV